MKNPFRKKNLPALPGPDDPLNALALRAALVNLDTHHEGIAEFKTAIAGWQKQLDDFVAHGDPMDHNRAIGAAAMKTRLEMAPNYLARAEEKTAPLIEALLGEVCAFERRLLAAGQSEAAALNAAIVPAVRPYCRDDADALDVARRCWVYKYLPVGPRSPILGTSINHEDLTFWNYGHESFSFAYIVERESAYAVPGGALARIEERLRARAADLLAAYKEWQARGRQWVPASLDAPKSPAASQAAAEPHGADTASEAVAETI